MKGRLYIISGPSACGKTTLVNSICSGESSRVLNTIKAPKYSTRPERDASDDITQLFDKNNKPLIQLGFGPFYSKQRGIVDVGETGIDIAYAINKKVYGISTGQISKLLKKGKNVFIILSDFRIIRRLLSAFPNQASTVYIASAVDTEKLEVEQTRRLGIEEDRKPYLEEQITRLKSAVDLELWTRVTERIGELNRYWEESKPGAVATKVRAERIRAFHTRYIEHITLFDYVILNYTEGAPEEMTEQMKNIILGKPKLSKAKVLYPPIFVVAAASGAGKGTLMEMLGLIGTDLVKLVSKLAGRYKKVNDKRDSTLAIGTPGSSPKKWPEWPSWWDETMIKTAMQGEFPRLYDLRWEFHKKGRQGTRYSVSSVEIERNIKEEIPQIFISNMGQFKTFLNRYGKRVIFIYLYRLSSAKDTEEWYRNVNPDPKDAEVRIKEIQKVHRGYIRQISEFDHVLLNTTHEEDLYDQMFQLLEYYYGIAQSGRLLSSRSKESLEEKEVV